MEIVLLSKMIGPNILLIDVVFFSVTFKYGKGANDIKKGKGSSLLLYKGQLDLARVLDAIAISSDSELTFLGLFLISFAY